jgi:hypothetical protein
MGQERDILKEPQQVIQEIEGQLDKLLQRKIDDIERDLAVRISQEQTAARRRKDEAEREFTNEREALEDYRTSIHESEAERENLLRSARLHFEKVVQLQSQIESMARATVDEIKNVTEIQKKVEALREKTSERAAFLKTDLRERFGIITEPLVEDEKPLGIDLDQELEKLRKIKDLLAIESAAAGLGEAASPVPVAGGRTPLDLPEVPEGIRIPEIQDLVAETSSPAETAAASPAVVPPRASRPVEAEPENLPEGGESDQDVNEAIEACRRSEPANGNGEIHYFQKDDTILIDGESLFAAIDKTMSEARRLSERLGQTESPKDQFFIKQELINWQEGLRALFLRVIKMTEKKAWRLPEVTGEVLNLTALRIFLERLSMENWSNPEEFASFLEAASQLKNAWILRASPRGAYLRALKKELEAF